MRKDFLKFIFLPSVMICLCFGCVEKIVEHVVAGKEAEVLQEHGPMEKWGARCDNKVSDISYAPGLPGAELLTLDVYYNNHEGLLPIVVNIHGGGWRIGDKRQINQVFRSKFIANRGYVVANVNYRLLPDFPIQTQVEDVMGAVIRIKEHAARFGADPSRVGVTGGSAGGHLTAMVAWASNDPVFSPTAHAESKYDSDVLAAVPFYGGFDIGKMLKSGDYKIKYFTGIKSFRKIKKGPERDELIRRLSPKSYISSDIPPTLFVCGDSDDFGLYPDSVNFEKRLRKLGVETGLYAAKGGKHGFDINYAADHTQKAMEATVAWFDRFLKR